MHGRNLTGNVANNSFFICISQMEFFFIYRWDKNGKYHLSGTKRICLIAASFRPKLGDIILERFLDHNAAHGFRLLSDSSEFSVFVLTY